MLIYVATGLAVVLIIVVASFHRRRSNKPVETEKPEYPPNIVLEGISFKWNLLTESHSWWAPCNKRVIWLDSPRPITDVTLHLVQCGACNQEAPR